MTVLLAALSSVPAEAQSVTGPKKRPDNSVVTAFHLKSANAAETAKLVGRLFAAKKIQVAAEESSNSLFVRAPRDVLKTIEELLQALDKPAPAKSADGEIKVFSLQHTQDPSVLRQMLDVAVGGTSARFAFDPRRNTIIAKGDKRSLDLMQAVVFRLDEGDNKPAATEDQIRIRLVWLVGGLKETTAEAPADLKEVVAELGKIGVKDLKLAAQMVVSTVPKDGTSAVASYMIGGGPGGFPVTTAGASFTAHGKTTLTSPTQARAAQLEIQGHVAGRRGENYVIAFSIQARQDGKQPGETPKPLCQIQSTIAAPPGHAVVLGVTPVESTNSVFVIQVLPTKKAAVRLPKGRLPKVGVRAKAGR